MFKLVKSHSDFKFELVKHMSCNNYNLPGDPDDAEYESDGDLLFPTLVNFTDEMNHTVRKVHVKSCKKTIAKTIIYPKTNKLSKHNQGDWTLQPNVSKYGQWLQDLIDEIDEGYGLNSDNIEAPADSILAVCSGSLFLSSYDAYFKSNNGVVWLKIFLVPLAKAKELVYCNKKPTSGYINWGTPGGVLTHSGEGGTTWTETITINTDNPCVAAGEVAVTHGSSPQYYTTGNNNVAIGYQAGTNVTTAEEEEEPPEEAMAHGSPHPSVNGVVWDSNRELFVHPSELSDQIAVDNNDTIQAIEPPDPTDPVLNINSNGLEWYSNSSEQAENTEEEEEQDDFIIEF